MEKSRTLMERILAALICLTILVGLLPAGVISVHAADTDALGTVTTKPEDLSVNADDPTKVTVTNDKVITLTKEAADASIGRAEGWYVGVEVTAPADYAGGATLDCDRPDGHPNGDSTDLSFDDNADVAGGKVVTLWALITEEWIKAGDVYYALNLDWDNDGTNDQTVSLTVDASNVVLLNADGSQVYPKTYGTIVTLPEDLTVEDSDPANITITNGSLISLTKHEADASIGRLEGWYVGVKIVAPVGYAGGATLDLTRPAGHPNGNSTDLDFDANVDVAGVSELTVWALITKEWIEAGDVTYVCALDWDNDGTADQTITLILNSANLILTDGDEGIWPDVYAKVTTTNTSAVVEGSDTNNVTVTLKDAELLYDLDKGQWHLPITVVAPSGINYDKATILYKDPTMTDEATANYGSESSQVYSLVLTPDDDYVVSGVLYGKFDWDGDGDVDQTITVQAENVTLKKLEQIKPEFQNGLVPTVTYDSMSTQGYGMNKKRVYTNAVNNADGLKVVYVVNDELIESIDENGKITFKTDLKSKIEANNNTYTVKIGAYFAETDYYAQSETVYYELTINVSRIAVSFEKTGDQTVVYSPNATFTNKASSNNYGVTITYSSSVESVATVDGTGKVSILSAGQTIITARAESEWQGASEVKYILTVEQADQPLQVKGEQTIIYNPDQTYSYNYEVSGIIVEGVTVGVAVVHKDATSAAELPEVTVDENGNIVVLPKDAGVFVLSVTAAGDNNYKEAMLELEITVLIEQSVIGFEKPGDHTVTFNDVNGLGSATADNVFANPVVNAMGTGKVTYTSSNTDVATVDDAGNVTVLKSGTTTITYTIESDGTYEAKTLEYTLTVEKADQTIAFPEANPAILLGIKKYQQSAVETSTYYGTGAITYKVIDANLEYKTNSFNSKNGSFELKQGKTGTITIQATKAADDCYNEATATYILSVGREAVPAVPYILSEVSGLNGWYTGTVTITAPEGYLISYKDSFMDADWTSSVEFSAEGISTTGIYLKNIATGGITSQVIIEGIKIDTTAPNSSISYDQAFWQVVLEKLTFGFYKAPVKVTITASDANNFLKTSGVDRIYYNYNGEWLNAAPDANGEITFQIPAQYRGQVSYYAVDAAGKAEDAKTDNTVLVVDDTDPLINVTYAYTQPEGAEGEAYYMDANGVIYTRYATTVTLTITEANFFAEDVVVTVTKDGKNHNVNVIWDSEGGYDIDVDNVQPYNGTFSLSEEGDYVVTVEYTDKSGNPMTTYTQQIHIDTKAPVITLGENLCTNENVTATITIEEHNFNADKTIVKLVGVKPDVQEQVLNVEWTSNGDIHTATVYLEKDSDYTLTVDSTDWAGNNAETATQNIILDHVAPESVEITYTNDVWGEVLEMLSFGYYQAEMTVTITATDLTSGVDLIYYNYNDEWLSATPDADGKITFPIDKQYRGKVSYYAVDKATNKTEEKIGNVEVIVDDIAPVINVTWTDAQQVADKNHYYNDKAVATVVITEDNFFNGEAEGREDGDDTSNKELGVQAFINGELATFESETWTAYVNEQGETVEGKWVNTIVLDQEGHYDLVIEYTDRSNNKMTTYTAETVTIDHTDPVVSVSPENSADRKYYDDTAVVTVTVKEHNFRAEDVNFIINAVDVAGNAVNGDVVYGEWTADASNPDVHTITLTFKGEANYTLDVEYKDLALRQANDLAQQQLTVDKTAPEKLTITYSEDLLSILLNTITFGFYDEPVTVTLTAVDDTAGIVEFSYEYILNSGVSSVNKGGKGSVEAKQDGNVFTATFKIPASALVANNQFDGYVAFTAVDRSGNKTVKSDKDSTSLIVDNIAPTASVTYNAPVQSANDISYYAGDIDVSIAITEANFFAEDVAVTVTKDGASYDVDVAWTNDSVDLHTGKFTLTEDGDYIVTVSYQDKSGNKMVTYTSNELTLDTTIPTINASNIVINSANKDEIYGFTVTINDTNLDASTLNTALQAVVQNEDGTYTVQNIDLGEAVTVAEGQTYTYTVENLTLDGLYTLISSVKDMSGNSFASITLDDGKAYESVQFSINREGSVFLFGDEFTKNLAGQYYVFSVENDVVIVEINVDPIETYSVKLNGKELTEGTDFTTTQTSEDGQWSKRTYVISKDLFAAEGEYSVIVSSTDKTSTTSYSDVKNLTVSFAVDQTKPVLTITGLENNGRYQTDEQTVTIIPSDEGGRLDSLKIVVLDADGNPLVDEETGKDISLRFEMSGEELRKYLEENDGKVTFTIPTCLNAQVQITCGDCASNAQGETNEHVETFTRVTVSPNSLVIFYANTSLFIGTIVGVLALLVVIIILIKRKKDKSEEKKAKA